jgi:anti-sigma regulatory factor (Ser/Thr protein kinase)
MLNGIASAPGRIQPLPQDPDSRAPRAPGFPGPLAGHSRSQEEGRRLSQPQGRAREGVRAASVVLLPCVPSSVAVARARIGAELRQAGLCATALADAALVTSELLSNAILHARPLPDACIRVSWILSATTVEIIVSDGGSPTRPRASRPSLSSIGGRGLGIVEHLCSSWGVRADERGTTVWAVVPASRGGSAGPGGGGPGGKAVAAGRSLGGPALAEDTTRSMDRAGHTTEDAARTMDGAARTMDGAGRSMNLGGPGMDVALFPANGTKHAAGRPTAQAVVTHNEHV